MTKLLPCPFCGSKAELEVDDNHGARIYYSVYCTNLACPVDTGNYFTEAEAITAWNTRAPLAHPAVKELVEAAKDCPVCGGKGYLERVHTHWIQTGETAWGEPIGEPRDEVEAIECEYCDKLRAALAKLESER